MRKNSLKLNRKAGSEKLVTGILVGGVVGATLGWLTAPATGAEIRRRLRGEVMSAHDRAKTAAGNLESRVRELAEEVRDKGESFMTKPEQTAAIRS